MIHTQHNSNLDKKSPCGNIFAMVGSDLYLLSLMEGTDIAFSVASEPGLRFFLNDRLAILALKSGGKFCFLRVHIRGKTRKYLYFPSL